MSLFFGCLLAYTVLSCDVRKGYDEGTLRSHEDALRRTLLTVRAEIKRYTSDNGHPPRSLSDLVTSGQMSLVPVDPITGKADWTIIFYDCQLSTDCKNGIKDVHSASTAKSTKGDLYSDW